MTTIEDIMKKLTSYIGWILLLSAVSFYVYGIYQAIYYSFVPPPPDGYPIFLSTTIASIQALLLTNLGFILGISVTDPTSRVAIALGLGKAATGNNITLPAPLDVKTQVQLFALVLFLISLIACIITWIIKDFKVIGVVPLISESSKMFMGVILAYLSTLLR